MIDRIIIDTASQRKTQVGEKVWMDIIKYAYLSSIDNLWIDHLDSIDDMRSGIGLRGYGQRDPLVEYKREAFNMFERLMSQIDSEFVKRLFRIQVNQGPQNRPQQTIEIKPEIKLPTTNSQRPMTIEKPSDFMSAFAGLQKGGAENSHKTLGRNDPCWCGSGKKYKKCHYPN
jgi:preprotein translocase subunit SecA